MSNLCDVIGAGIVKIRINWLPQQQVDKPTCVGESDMLHL